MCKIHEYYHIYIYLHGLNICSIFTYIYIYIFFSYQPERDQGRKGLGLKVEAHPSLQHLFEKTTSDTGKIPFNLIPKANFATTKANQRVAQAATKKKQMKVEKPDIEAFADPSKNPYYDPNLAVESLAPKSRISRHLRFNKQGKYIELANQMRTQARLEKLKQEIADSVKKTGMDVELDLVSDMSVKVIFFSLL